MKQSHYTAPRTMADCQWTQGYEMARPPRRASWRETAKSAALSATIFAVLAGVLFFWWSA